MVAVAAAGLGAVSITNGLADRERSNQETAAAQSAAAVPACVVTDRKDLAPAAGALFGVNLDLDATPLSRYAADLGHKPTVNYHVYGQDHGKPVAIPETAALYNPAAGGAAEVDIKRLWWEQVFSPETQALFPNLKMINWFEWDKNEVEVNGRIDWTVTNTPAIRNAFTTSLPAWLHYGTGTTCRPPAT